MTRKQKQWGYGLASGFIGSFFGSVDSGLALMIMHPVKFNLGAELKATLETMAILGLLTGGKVAAAYLRNSPLPPIEGDTVIIEKNTTMKDIMKLFVLTTVILGVTYAVRAAEPVLPAVEKPAPRIEGKAKSWWTDFSVTPIAVLNHPNFDAPQWGAGLDVGLNLNRTVSLHVANLAYETDRWKGSAIDETSLLVRADLIRDSRERFVGYVLSGGDRDWVREDWAFGVGVGAELRLTKNVSIGADSRIRAFFNHDKDLLSRAFLSFRF